MCTPHAQLEDIDRGLLAAVEVDQETGRHARLGLSGDRSATAGLNSMTQGDAPRRLCQAAVSPGDGLTEQVRRRLSTAALSVAAKVVRLPGFVDGHQRNTGVIL